MGRVGQVARDPWAVGQTFQFLFLFLVEIRVRLLISSMK